MPILFAVLAVLASLLLVGPTASASGEPAITGRVTDAITGQPLAGVPVVAGFFADDVNSTPFEATTGADGTYRLPVYENNTYRVQFFFPGDYEGGNYYTQFYDGHPALPYYARQRQLSTPVTVGSGTVTGIDCHARPWPTITGRVTYPSGAPAPGVRVELTMGAGLFHDSATTRSDGTYAVQSPPYDVAWTIPASIRFWQRDPAYQSHQEAPEFMLPAHDVVLNWILKPKTYPQITGWPTSNTVKATDVTYRARIAWVTITNHGDDNLGLRADMYSCAAQRCGWGKHKSTGDSVAAGESTTLKLKIKWSPKYGWRKPGLSNRWRLTAFGSRPMDRGHVLTRVYRHTVKVVVPKKIR